MTQIKEPLDRKNYLAVPTIQKMNASPSDQKSEDDDENGLGYHHTLVSFSLCNTDAHRKKFKSTKSDKTRTGANKPL